MSVVKNILIVDDEKTNINILLSFFQTYQEIEKVNIIVSLTGKKALEIVKERDIDLILLDVVMPEMDGYEVCKILKSDEKTKNIPIIFITSKNDEESLAKGFSLGANDYVIKPFNTRELMARVKLNLELQSYVKKLEYFAFFDSMTNLYNRRKFFELGLKQFDLDKEDLYVLILDIDKFKSINDTFGHHAGDIVIKSIAKILKERLHDNGILGRIGGEEFAFICTNDSFNHLESLIENLRMEIESTEIIIDDNNVLNCTISIGISKYSNQPSLDYLLHDADTALYSAKNTGRNKSIFRI